MASQVLNLGADTLSGEGNWEGAILVDAALIEGGGTAYLRQVRVSGTSIIVRLATSADVDPADAGPEFTPELELADTALTFAEVGGTGIVLKGPAHPDNTFADSTEVYFWTPDNGRAWNAWALGVGSGVVTLKLDDGQTTPNLPVAATFAAAVATLAVALAKRAPGTQPISATLAGVAGSLSLALAKRAAGAKPIAVRFQGIAGSLSSLALTKRSVGAARPIAATFAARAASLAVALTKAARLSESVRRRIHSTSGSWDGVRVGDLVAVGRATSYAREVEVAAVRYDDRTVRLTLVDYPETLYDGERPLGDFRPGDSIPGPYLGPACPRDPQHPYRRRRRRPEPRGHQPHPAASRDRCRRLQPPRRPGLHRAVPPGRVRRCQAHARGGRRPRPARPARRRVPRAARLRLGGLRRRREARRGHAGAQLGLLDRRAHRRSCDRPRRRGPRQLLADPRGLSRRAARRG